MELAQICIDRVLYSCCWYLSVGGTLVLVGGWDGGKIVDTCYRNSKNVWSLPSSAMA